MGRIKEVDIAKGVGILLVVIGHLIDQFDVEGQIVYRFIYLFHMPLFFFLSGMFFREEEKFSVFFIKKFKRLFVPFALANLFFFAVEMTRAYILGDRYDGSLGWVSLPYSVFGLGTVPSMLVHSTWFILALFRIYILYWLLDKLLGNRKLLLLFTCFVTGVIGMITAWDELMIGQTLASLPFFCMGNVCGTGFLNNKKLFDTKRSVVFMTLSIPVLYFISKYQLTNMAVNCYGNIAFFFLGAVVGILFILWLCVLLQHANLLSNTFSFIGQHTLSILIWHVFAMLVLSKIVGTSGFMPCLLLVVFGVGAPIALSLVWGRVKLIFTR